MHAVVPGVEETLKWSMPSFTLGGKILANMAAFKAHATVNFWRGQELGFETRSGAMGQLGRLRSVDDLPSDFDAMIARAAELSASGPAPRQVKHVPKPTPEMHPDFLTALGKAPAARATFDNFPPSCRRDYVEWIAEAKKDETRDKRIATAIEWLSAGKKRHWKYESC
jgi:hypothetical protein